MAELSEKDKRTLLGENYREVLAKAEQEGSVKTARHQDWASAIEKSLSKQFSAAAVMIVGALIVVSNYLAVSGPSVMLVGVFGAVIFFAGVGWYWRLRNKLRDLNANPPASEQGPSESPAPALALSAGAARQEQASAKKPQDHPPLEAASVLNR